MKKVWDKEKIAQIRELRKNGASVPEICKLHGCHPPQVYNWCKDLKPPKVIASASTGNTIDYMPLPVTPEGAYDFTKISSLFLEPQWTYTFKITNQGTYVLVPRWNRK